jgi:malonyl-CoA decarboxylase
VQTLLDQKTPALDPARADTAIFYSISNAQRGLAGISFGNFLIKRVVDQLRAELPRLRTFATLSPVPNFRPWLDTGLRPDGEARLLPAEMKAMAGLHDGGGEAHAALAAALRDRDWHRNAKLAEILRPALTRLCAVYLLRAKRPDGRALDPVAHFHLTNGARLERLNWMGDTSETGCERAAGMMVNYLYPLDEIDANHEAYTGAGTVAASSPVRKLAGAR